MFSESRLQLLSVEADLGVHRDVHAAPPASRRHVKLRRTRTINISNKNEYTQTLTAIGEGLLRNQRDVEQFTDLLVIPSFVGALDALPVLVSLLFLPDLPFFLLFPPLLTFRRDVLFGRILLLGSRQRAGARNRHLFAGRHRADIATILLTFAVEVITQRMPSVDSDCGCGIQLRRGKRDGLSVMMLRRKTRLLMWIGR